MRDSLKLTINSESISEMMSESSEEEEQNHRKYSISKRMVSQFIEEINLSDNFEEKLDYADIDVIFDT